MDGRELGDTERVTYNNGTAKLAANAPGSERLTGQDNHIEIDGDHVVGSATPTAKMSVWTPSAEEIAARVSVLQEEGYSNPAFEKTEEEFNGGERGDRVAPLRKPSGLVRPSGKLLPPKPPNRKISLGYDTKERVPELSNYELDAVEKARPTLGDLRAEQAVVAEDAVRNTGNEKKMKRGNLGWIRGVVLWSILNLWGVMLFLRIAWMVAQAGMGLFFVIVLISTIVAILTSLSTSAISTNGDIGIGGTYFMISRSLGPQFGAAIENREGVGEERICRKAWTETTLNGPSLDRLGPRSPVLVYKKSCGGHSERTRCPLGHNALAFVARFILDWIIFTLANIINVSLNLQGFADTFVNLIQEAGAVMVDHLNDVRIVAVITLVLLTGFTFFGMEIASKLQLVFFVILVGSIVNIVVGSIIPPSPQMQANGFVGYSSALFRENWAPAFQRDSNGDNSFMTVFGVFFPSVTGILAGTSITGDLRDPSGAIPKGTIVAILFTSASYILIGWVTGAVTLRHASGNLTDLIDGNLTACMNDHSCTQGSINNMEIMEVVGHFRPLILAGIFSATLSTSLGCINFAPKIFQALCRDNIFPGIHIFGKGYGKEDEPYRAYGLVLIIAVIFLMPADLNFISNIVSNCFLLTYALVNYATFDASYSNSPGWRPTFKYYNKWLSLFTAVGCVILMFFLDWMSAIIAIGIIFLLWLYVYHKNPQVNWGTSGEANMYRRALKDSLQLLKIEDHVKNYRPQILLLSGLPCCRPALVYFANSITRSTGLLICGHVLVGRSMHPRKTLVRETYRWLQRRKLKAFYDHVAATHVQEGMRALIQTSGLGKLKPNIVMMGYQQSWNDWTEEALLSYIGTINDALDANLAIAILWAKEGYDLSEIMNFDQIVRHNADEELKSKTKSSSVLEPPETSKAVPLEVQPTNDPDLLARIALAEKFEPGKKNIITGEIHVWWLFDDGGLTLLIPYLMTRNTPWNGCRLKIFCLAGPDPEESKKNMHTLLDKFRIQAVDVVPVDMDKPPTLKSQDWFNSLMTEYRVNEVTRKISRLEMRAQEDLEKFSERTLQHIRLRELMLELSSEAVLNVVTMPLPKQGRDQLLYMAVLDTLTRGMPLTMLVRGTQESVLTYYC